MRIGIGCDHAAVELKNAIKVYLEEMGHTVVDYGPAASTEKMDYPIPGRKVAEEIAAGTIEKGVLICGTGIGISLAANKVPGIRAAVVSEPYSASMAVRHNDAQIIAFGARVVGVELAKLIVKTFFEASFEGGRHADRVELIRAIERDYNAS